MTGKKLPSLLIEVSLALKNMPFGLISAGATFQRTMDVIFASQIGRNMEVYVDDMIVKSKQLNHHDIDLRESFDNIRKYKKRINPAKCTFGVASGKFLGFMLTQRGIEADPKSNQSNQRHQTSFHSQRGTDLDGVCCSIAKIHTTSIEAKHPIFPSDKVNVQIKKTGMDRGVSDQP